MDDEKSFEKMYKLPDEYLLHLIPQETFHSPATIRASKASFQRLALALKEASLLEGGSKLELMMTAADGEYYKLELEPVDVVELSKGPWPYAQLGHPWEYVKANNPGTDWLTMIVFISIGVLLGGTLVGLFF